MPDDSLAQLRIIWQNAGGPGQAKFRATAQRTGLSVSVQEAADFARAPSVAQVFSLAPRSGGKVIVPEVNSSLAVRSDGL